MCTLDILRPRTDSTCDLAKGNAPHAFPVRSSLLTLLLSALLLLGIGGAGAWYFLQQSGEGTTAPGETFEGLTLAPGEIFL